MTHLDLFSGIGGFALAAQWAGFETIAFSEVNKYAIRVLAKHWPHVQNLGDIKKYEQWPELGTIDLLTGGFPCQPFSNAGKRRGKRDDRYLWPSMLGVIQRYRPTWVLGENVTGFISLGLDTCLSDLETAGYSARTFILPACAVGAKHRRDRCWIVATNSHTDSHGFQGWTHTKQNTWVQKEFERLVQVELRISIPTGKCDGVAHGVSHRVDKLQGLGNAIVPQVAYEILRCINLIVAGSRPRMAGISQSPSEKDLSSKEHVLCRVDP